MNVNAEVLLGFYFFFTQDSTFVNNISPEHLWQLRDHLLQQLPGYLAWWRNWKSLMTKRKYLSIRIILFSRFSSSDTHHRGAKKRRTKKILFLMILTYMINSILWVFQLTAKVFNILLQAIKYIRYNSWVEDYTCVKWSR